VNDATRAVEQATSRRFTQRLVVMEEPEVIESLQQQARDSGHSVAAEVRAALRYWRSVWEQGQ
jgi:hypothetical protein